MAVQSVAEVACNEAAAELRRVRIVASSDAGYTRLLKPRFFSPAKVSKSIFLSDLAVKPLDDQVAVGKKGWLQFAGIDPLNQGIDPADAGLILG